LIKRKEIEMQRERYNTYQLTVRVPMSNYGSARRMTTVNIVANDAYAAKCIANGQYGSQNVLTNAIKIRSL